MIIIRIVTGRGHRHVIINAIGPVIITKQRSKIGHAPRGTTMTSGRATGNTITRNHRRDAAINHARVLANHTITPDHRRNSRGVNRIMTRTINNGHTKRTITRHGRRHANTADTSITHKREHIIMSGSINNVTGHGDITVNDRTRTIITSNRRRGGHPITSITIHRGNTRTTSITGLSTLTRGRRRRNVNVIASIVGDTARIISATQREPHRLERQTTLADAR
jgi:hypothetical protein